MLKHAQTISDLLERKGGIFLRRAFFFGMIGYPALELLYRGERIRLWRWQAASVWRD